MRQEVRSDPDNMYINRLPVRAMHPKLKVMLSVGNRKIAINALIDSGATCSTIHPRITRTQQLPLKALPIPRTVRNADGTPNKEGKITHELNTLLHDGLANLPHTFAVINTGTDDIILGIDYLQKRNPEINWKEKTLTDENGRSTPFTISRVKHKRRERKKKKKKRKGKRQTAYIEMDTSEPSVQPGYRPRAGTASAIPRQVQQGTKRQRSPSIGPSKKVRLEEETRPKQASPPQGTWASNWAPKAIIKDQGRIQRYDEEQSAGNDVSPEETTEDMDIKRHWAPSKTQDVKKHLNKWSSVAQQYSQQKAESEGRLQTGKEQDWKKLLPPQIADYADVFDPNKARRIPEHTKWDMKINLDPDKPLPKVRKIIKLARDEEKAVKEQVAEMTSKHWIDKVEPHEPCPVAAPVFFVGKKDGGARMVTDYRDINTITIPDPYPIPIMGAMPEKLQGAKHFFTLDMRSGYNNLRIAEGDEWKAAFRTSDGVYKPKVMMFGMKNSPAVFQRYMNENFAQWLATEQTLIYLDDLIGQAQTEEEQWKLLREILQQCRNLDIYLKIEKCHFNQKRLDYLGFIVSTDGLHMDPYKLKAVEEWPAPTTKKQITKFTGFCNFYRKFIKGYADLFEPITRLVKKDRRFEWGSEQEQAFAKIKEAFRKEVTLSLPDHDQPFVLECDASDVAAGAVLQQPGPTGDLQPVGFYSHAFGQAERNYKIHDKEMLAIMLGLAFWRHLIQGAKHVLEIRSDHANLRYFMTKQHLNRRQARWALELSIYNFELVHWPGIKNKADALSRRADYVPDEKDNVDLVLLPEDKIGKTLEPTDTKGMYILRTEVTVPSDPILKTIKNGYKTEAWTTEFESITQEQKTKLAYSFKDGIHRMGHQIWVPPDKNLRTLIMRRKHDDRTAGHPGILKTTDLVKRQFYWPTQIVDTKEYVQSCDVCQRTKSPRQARNPPIQPLELPTKPWDDISCDLITDLPVSTQGFDTLLVIQDRFTKIAIFEPSRGIPKAKELSEMFLRRVFKHFGTPKKIVSDRGTNFIAKFMSEVARLLGIEWHASTAYHPQTDGQTERLNQELEQYLRCYVGFRQTDWADHLELAAFAYNNRKHSATGQSPFYTLYGWHPHLHLLGDQLYVPEANEYRNNLREVQEEAYAALKKSQENMKLYADLHRGQLPKYKEGDEVMLDMKNLQRMDPTRKLGDKWTGPFKVLKAVGTVSYKLDFKENQLPIHPVFHASLLKPYHRKDYPGRPIRNKPPPVLIDQEPEYELDKILTTRKHYQSVKYFVSWKGYDETNNSLIPLSNLANSARLVRQFHREHPTALKPNGLAQWLERHLSKKKHGSIRERKLGANRSKRSNPN